MNVMWKWEYLSLKIIPSLVEYGNLEDAIDTLMGSSSDATFIDSAGERFMVVLYGSNDDCLNHLRYNGFSRQHVNTRFTHFTRSAHWTNDDLPATSWGWKQENRGLSTERVTRIRTVQMSSHFCYGQSCFNEMEIDLAESDSDNEESQKVWQWRNQSNRFDQPLDSFLNDGGNLHAHDGDARPEDETVESELTLGLSTENEESSNDEGPSCSSEKLRR
ncbi:hypothetical protein FQA39_LY02843 [Lamprigera yunnana]|nr:hypothetical protein FQA39_LY02843 [Lamprigera yunnana]